MTPTDKKHLLALLPQVCAFYKQDFSEFLGHVWLAATEPYSFAEVKSAIERHTMNPDSGQFMPKPADLVRMMGGTSTDVALGAWSKVERAIRSIGQFTSVVFDDPLIHRVVHDMGGWILMCTSAQTERDFEFVGKEFQTRYRGFAMRSERPEYPAHLIGVTEANHTEKGYWYNEPPRAIGDPRRCMQVLAHGMDADRVPRGLLVPREDLPRLPGASKN